MVQLAGQSEEAESAQKPTIAKRSVEVGGPCPNCGESVHGNFCSNCGQRNVVTRLTLRQLAREVAGDFFHIDSKLVRTAWALISRPGGLTRDYLEGRRETFIRPFKVYLAASALLFGYSTIGNVRVASDAANVKVQFDKPEPDEPAFVTKMRENTAHKTPQQIAEQLEHDLRSYFPKLMFVLIPLFAALLRLLYIRRPFVYVEHFITALHLHAVVFLILLFNKIVGRSSWIPSPISDGIQIASFLAALVYMVVALHRVYGQSFLKSAIKASLLFVTYSVLLGLAAAGVTLGSLYFEA